MTSTSVTLSLSILGFIMTVIWGKPLIRLLRTLKFGKNIRMDGPESHMTKMGTPTMGGVMFIMPTLLITGMLNAVSLFGVNIIGQSFVLPMLAMVFYGLLGSIDDLQGMRGKRKGLGMKARTKFVVQILLAVVIAFMLKYVLKISYFHWPNYPEPIDLGVFYIPIAVFLVVGMSNAVNLSDGLDGLAGLISATAFVGYGVIAIMVGQIFIGRFCFILAGSLFGFLWFNVYPAELFMGDTGSLALGAALAVVALITGHLLVLPIIAIIPTSEAISDIIQVSVFKITKGKRVFRMAPLHHHYEKKGWSETQIVQRFWLVGLLGVMLGISIAMI